MNRVEFMARLETLLQNISVDERRDAISYYNDYFDDAGVENENRVISELGSPEKVAATIKADLKGQNDTGSEYSETGYTDTRFEERDIPANRAGAESKTPPRTSTLLKIILVILIGLTIIPFAWPVLVGILGLGIGLVCAAFGIFIGMVAGSVGLMIAGIIFFVIGIVKMFTFLPVGLLTSGSGLLLFVLGLILTVATVKLCFVIFPPMCRGLVNLCRRPFHRKEREVS